MAQNKVICIGDFNCDMLDENKALGRYDIKEMLNEYLTFMEDNGFALLNNKPTRHWPGVPSTLIDHLVTNYPSNCDNVITKPTHISDHESVSCNFHVQRLKERPKSIKVRDYKLLTRQNLMHEIMQHERLNNLFSISDVNAKWECLINVYNDIINKLAPQKIIQVCDNQAPYINDEIKEEEKLLNQQLSTAINSKDLNEWRLYRAMRNVLYKVINKVKTQYYVNMLKNLETCGKLSKI